MDPANNNAKVDPTICAHFRLSPELAADDERPFPITRFLRFTATIYFGESRNGAGVSSYPAPAKPPAADPSVRNWRKINNYLNI
jgi:hypothetical protein